MATAFDGNFAARGSVTIKSADPKDLPTIDPKFLAEPFDRRVAIESVRETLELLDSPHLAKDQVRLATGPEDRSDEAILVCCLSVNFRDLRTMTLCSSSLRVSLGLCPQNRDQYVAQQRYCPDGQGESPRHMRRQKFSSMWSQRTQSGRYECGTISTQVRWDDESKFIRRICGLY